MDAGLRLYKQVVSRVHVPRDTILCGGGAAVHLIGDIGILQDANPGTPLAAEVADILAKARTIVAELQETRSDREGAMGKMEATVGE